MIVLSLIVVVLLPALAAGTYLFAIASDQYAAEARFAVRTPELQDGDTTSPATVLTSGGSLGGQDADIVANYIHSRAIIDDISKTVDLRAIFQRPEADVLARLPKTASAEDLTAYWNRMVSVYIQGTSGIVTVEARAFRREDALLVAELVLKSSQTLVGGLSSAMRADAMKHAEDEIRRSEAIVQSALTGMTAFRNAQGLIDPVKSADQTGTLLMRLMADKIRIEGALFVARRTSPNAPGVASLRDDLDSTNTQIDTLRRQLAGGTGANANMASTIAKFEDVDLKRQFAERMYGFARDGLDRARLAAERRSVYLAVFVPPSLPEDYSYPLRFSNFILIALAAAVSWCCGATICASVLDHRL